jgi:hypothetical protein
MQPVEHFLHTAAAAVGGGAVRIAGIHAAAGVWKGGSSSSRSIMPRSPLLL